MNKTKDETMNTDIIQPKFKDGRVFVSPVIGCNGGCKYCYLKLRNLNKPSLNNLGVSSLIEQITSHQDFISGKNGTIISIGAWGDIFQNIKAVNYSVELIIELMKLGNPIQFMSKYGVDSKNASRIANNIQYHNQMLYSTTITSLEKWDELEPFTFSPKKRLDTCNLFQEYGIESNVLIKPFLPGITDIEFEHIIDLLIERGIKYCVVGKLYLNKEIQYNLIHSGIMCENIIKEHSTLDCNGDIEINSSSITSLYDFIKKHNDKRIKIFLKSSCVNSNINQTNNPSNYFINHSRYCINCGNCSKNRILPPR